MTEIIFDRNGILNLGAISRLEDLNPQARIVINGPPSDGRCEVCGRHVSELEPFGGPGDPLVGDFTGELLVKGFRPDFPLPDEIKRAQKEESIRSRHDFDSWFIANYGEDEMKRLDKIFEVFNQVGTSWECRDCIVLDDDEYFEKLRQRYHGNKNG